MKLGVDVSTWQEGVDYARAKAAGVEFAILRAGQAGWKDDMLETHYAGFKIVGVPMGAYQYSEARNIAGAKAEAEAMQRWCKGKAFGLPVYLDMEESSVFRLGHIVVTAIAEAWVKTMRAAGYSAGVYANASWWNEVLDRNVIRAAGGSIWVADWSRDKPAWADLWQFGGETNVQRSAHIDGIPGAVDQNYLINEKILTAAKAAEEAKTETKAETKATGGNKIMVELSEIRKGCTGAQVKTVQRLLIACGYNCGGYGADGDCGAGTEASIIAFQKANGLAADGIVGQNTWNKLLKG